MFEPINGLFVSGKLRLIWVAVHVACIALSEPNGIFARLY